jgi:glutamate/tyrosine decarboxylase-like PLP-dependent enzyme
VVDDVADLLEQGGVQATHPRYFGLFVPGVRSAGIIADALVAAYNPQLGAAWHHPAASRIEALTLDHLRARVGFPPSAAATFTTGGSEANLTAVLAALAWAFPRYAAKGLTSLTVRPILYVSDQAHDSFVKIARTTGLGEEALHRVPSDQRQRMDIDALKRAIVHDRTEGRSPFLVVATVGTTATGAIDPLGPLAELCRRERLWMHADAAWGGLALFSEALRPHVAGVEQADSVTWDAHKTLPVPMGAGMFFCRSRRFTDAVFSVRTGYIPESEPGALDPYQHTLQWSRRFIGLKVFLTLAEYGAAGVAALVDRQVAIAEQLRDALSAHGWRVTNDTPLPLVCFTHPNLAPEAVPALARAVTCEGRAWISDVRLPDGARWLRACVTHPDTGPEDVRELVEAVRRAHQACGG